MYYVVLNFRLKTIKNIFVPPLQQQFSLPFFWRISLASLLANDLNIFLASFLAYCLAGERQGQPGSRSSHAWHHTGLQQHRVWRFG